MREDEAEEGQGRARWGEPLWELLRSWGPAVLLVLLVRSILLEPFQIPSGSMVPTLLIGDFILVSKLSYGLHLPFWDLSLRGIKLPLGEAVFGREVWLYKLEDIWRPPEGYRSLELIPLEEPKRGDIVVFTYPPTQDSAPTDYIKRVVGLPGDVVELRDNVLYVNGVEQPRREVQPYLYIDQYCSTDEMTGFIESIDGAPHPVLQTTSYAHRMAPDYGPKTVAAGEYFVMGDNRDNSADSRVWGLVPRDNLRGKALLVWLSYDTCVPSMAHALRWDRIGHALR